MPKDYLQIKTFEGLSNLKNARDIGFGLSKAQNVSIDKHGMIRTIGGLEDFTKVDGVTALTQTAKICPGSGLFPYGSDHWRGTDTVVDICAQDNAASDHDADNDGPDAVGSWVDNPNTDTSSVADEDGGIASNGTSYILKLIRDVGVGVARVKQTIISAVVGQRYIFSIDLYNKDGAYILAKIGSGAIDNNLGQTPKVTAAAWTNKQFEFVADNTTIVISVDISGLTNQGGYFDDVYITKIPRCDLDTNWLALADAASANGAVKSQVDLYNVNDDSFAAGLLDFGTVSSYVATADTINFPTNKTITDSTGQFLNQGIQEGGVRIISGCTSETANNIMFVVEHVSAGTIRARGNPFTVQADEDGTVTLTKYNPVAFHYVNEALRASPANGGIALRPKHYSFADRTHFEGAESSERKFSNWFLNDVGPVAPTDVEATTANGDGTAANLTAGVGFEIGITRTADNGDWVAGTYIIAIAFKYDDGQISALYVPSTDEEFGTAILDGDSLTLTVRGKMSSTVNYNGRISGGYIFCRLDESDEPWSLLADISMAKGARATLSGMYNAWNESSTANVAYTNNFKSLKLNLDSYESLAGIDPTTPVEVFTGDNAFWNASVIAGNRCFIGSVRYTDAGGSLAHFRDRILYSQAGRFDTFPITNYIDVVQGDAEDYIKLGIYGNDLLCFKQRTLYIVDISDPDPAGWQMKQDANKGKYPFRGLRHPGAYFETPIGPAWCNEFGVFLYNGSEIVPLLGDKIELSEHPLAYQRYMEFDGTDDAMIIADDADLDFGNGDGSIRIIVAFPDPGAANYILGRRTDIDNRMYLAYLSGLGIVAYFKSATTLMANAYVAFSPDADRFYDILWTFENGVSNNIYVNGVDQTPLDGDNHTGGAMNLATALKFGQIGNDSIYGNVKLARVEQYNRKLTAAEVLALYNGQPVLAADQGATQTAMNVSNCINGVTNPYDSFSGASPTGFRADADNATDQRATTADEIAFVNTKKYRVSFTLTVNEGGAASVSFVCKPAEVGGALIGSTAQGCVSGLNTNEFTAGETNTGMVVFSSNVVVDYTISNLKVVPIGCVAEYAPKGIGDATWEDQSGNSLDGTVVGATAIMEDSWKSFYTDYSILGYHARTNQLIIMRDCTGRWSSGVDHGDCWIVDLDTGAITTGRRIFTAKTAYSNWETDWANELIIAEQTNSTTVTIKRWSEEPHEQAVGLIDIRFADLDFDNPAIIKIIDAFLATYKSSAAQVNPLSYAVDGSDLHTAWTRLNGNFLATDDWKRLIIEPTTNIQCASIRLKMDNPIAATKIELNDSTVRNEPQILKLE